MSVDAAAIREACKRASQGEWEANGPLIFVANGRVLAGDFTDDVGYYQGAADAELIVLLRNNAEALLDELERAQAASEGVDMLVAQAERRGAEKVRERLEQIPEEVYSTSIFGSLSSEDIAKIRQGIESVGYTMDSLSGHILRFGYEAAARIASQVIETIEDER